MDDIDRAIGHEVTEEALRCGADELAGYDDRFETAEEAARRIYIVMRRCVLNSRKPSSHEPKPIDLADLPKLLES